MQKTIPEVFFETAKKYSEKAALFYKKEGVYFPVTYKEFSDKVKIFSAYLQSAGVEPADKVAILSENRPEWIISDLSIMAAGAITVPLHTSFSADAICRVLEHSESKILIVSNAELLNKVLLSRNPILKIEKIIFLETPSAGQREIWGQKLISWQNIFSEQINQNFKIVSRDPEACCSIIYTSGTTGDPKGVVLSHKNFLSNAEAVSQAVSISDKDVFLSFLPLSHVLERLAGYYVPILLHGSAVAYAEGIKQMPQNLKEARPTIIISVPRVFEKFHDAIWDKVNASSAVSQKIFKWALKQNKKSFTYKIADLLAFKKVRDSLGGRLRLAVSGGASLSDQIERFFSKIGITILEGYGLTETSPVISVNRENDSKLGSVGKAIPGIEVKIAGNKEILVRGPSVFSGYFKNDFETEKSFDKDGWFYTGDLGFIDKSGFLTIIGRAKEMIVTSGGKNVWPERMENLLNNDKFISQSMIIGNKRKFISALIVPDWQEVEIYFKQNNLQLQEHSKLINSPILLDIFQKRLDEKINPNLHEYEQIRKFKILPQEFSQEAGELTATLKLRRHIIESHCQKSIEAMYS